METSLHRQLKAMYAGADGLQEVVHEGYRIDAIRGGELIEIQHGSLAAIRDKIRTLCAEHRVRIVKPIIANKLFPIGDAKPRRAFAQICRGILDVGP